MSSFFGAHIDTHSVQRELSWAMAAQVVLHVRCFVFGLKRRLLCRNEVWPAVCRSRFAFALDLRNLRRALCAIVWPCQARGPPARSETETAPPYVLRVLLPHPLLIDPADLLSSCGRTAPDGAGRLSDFPTAPWVRYRNVATAFADHFRSLMAQCKVTRYTGGGILEGRIALDFVVL